VLVLVAAYILYEAYERIRNPPEIQSIGMLVIAVIGLAVNYTGMRVLRGGAEASLNILLQGVPAGLALNEIEQAILAIPGVQAIHDLHVWALTSGRNSLTVHIVLARAATEQEVLSATADMLARRFALTHTTIQVEDAACGQADTHIPHSAMHEEHRHGH
jgi:Co/Zn/Cd efflux system component